jgi:hypothetical protein
MTLNKKHDNKERVKHLINIGLFDEHIDELSKALYSKRLFTKDIKCFFNNKIRNKLDNYLTPKTINKKEIFHKNNKRNNNNSNKSNIINLKKKKGGDINFYEFSKYKEEELNKDMKNLLISLNSSQDETKFKFQELKEENDYFSSLYKVYNELKNRKTKKSNSDDDNNIFIFLYDLLLKYKSQKKLSFDINSLFSDILRETPLASTDLEKLKFFYIINPERFDIINNYLNKENINIKKRNKINPLLAMYNNSADSSLNKNEVPKEPKIIDMTKMKYLKEIKYLNKVNRRTKYKIINGGNLIGLFTHKSPKLKKKRNLDDDNNNDNENEDNLNDENEEEEYEDIEKYENQFNIKQDKKRIKLEIQKDNKEINRLKKTINDFFHDDKNYSMKLLEKTNSNINIFNKGKTKYSLNRNDRNDNKKKTFFSIDNGNNDNNIINNKKFEFFKPINNKLLRNTSYDKFSINNDYYTKDMFYKIKKNNEYNSTFLSNRGNCQHSTFYSNQSINNFINNSSISKFSPNNSTSLSYKFYNTPKNKRIFQDNKYKKITFNNFNSEKSKKNKDLKKSKTLFQDDKKTDILDNIIKYKTENIYYISKKLNGKNKKAYINKINDYFKYKNSKLPLLFKKNDFKETFFFFHRLKNEIQNNDIKYKYQNARKFLNDKEKKKLNDIENLDCIIADKEKELLTKVLKRKL